MAERPFQGFDSGVSDARREFRAAMQRAGLGEWVKDKNADKRRRVAAFRFHDLRHYAVSELIKQKADILLLARIAGHEDPSITLRIYAHLMNDDVSDAAGLYDPLRVPARRPSEAVNFRSMAEAPLPASSEGQTGT